MVEHHIICNFTVKYGQTDVYCKLKTKLLFKLLWKTVKACDIMYLNSLF